jgi:hypothetical protein
MSIADAAKVLKRKDPKDEPRIPNSMAQKALFPILDGESCLLADVSIGQHFLQF